MALVLEETVDYLVVEEPQWDEGPYHWGQCRHCDYGTSLGSVQAVRVLIRGHVGDAHPPPPEGE